MTGHHPAFPDLIAAMVSHVLLDQFGSCPVLGKSNLRHVSTKNVPRNSVAVTAPAPALQNTELKFLLRWLGLPQRCMQEIAEDYINHFGRLMLIWISQRVHILG